MNNPLQHIPWLPSVTSRFRLHISRRNLLAIGALTLGCAMVAALLLPRPNPFPYRYALGQPWNYRTLKAPFDFEVLFPEDQVRIDVARVKAEHGPYFILRESVVRSQKKLLAASLAEQARISKNDVQYEDLVRNLSTYKDYGNHMLDVVLDRGIVGDQDLEKIKSLPGKNWHLVRGANVQPIAPDSLLTLRQAHNVLSDSLPYAPLRQPELLLPLLEKALVPNALYSDSLTEAMLRQNIAKVTGTGELVKKGEVVVQRNELVNASVFRKLDSLAHRFDVQSPWELWASRLLLCFVAFALFFTFLLYKEVLPRYLPGTVLWVLGSLAAVFACMFFGAAVALMLPLWILPGVSHKSTRAPIGYAVWALVVLLTTLSLDWASCWLSVQVAGVAGMLMFFPNAETDWRAQLLSMLTITGIQSLFWLSMLWSNNIPPALCTPDTLLFLVAGNVFAWLAVRFLPIFRPAV